MNVFFYVFTSFKLIISKQFYLFHFCCLLKWLLKGNKYFEGIKHSLENWRGGDSKVFSFINLFISLLKYLLFFYFMYLSCVLKVYKYFW